MTILATCFPAGITNKIAAWAGLSFFLNLIWEIAQLPLYTIPSAQTAAQVAYAVAHCTLGDVVLAATSFLAVALLLRDPDWPAARPWRGGTIVVLSGVAYTAFTEWYSVYQAGYWGYTSSMPLVFGIGLSPLLQWIVIPVGTVLIIRALRAARQTLD